MTRYVRLVVCGTISLAMVCSRSIVWGQVASERVMEDHAPRIKRIENGLRPLEQAVIMKGDATSTIDQRMAHYGVPGVGIAVIHDGRVVWHRTYGVTDRETGKPVSAETLFQAGSVSKPVAAFGALRLVQDGKLSLDEDINESLNSWKLPNNEFTESVKVNLTHLLSHTGGLTVHGFPGYAVGTPVPSLVQVLDGSGPANTPPIRVDKEPGGDYRYSGGGFTVAQQMMIDVSGQSFPDLMEATVLGPLGMSHSTYENPLPPSLLQHAAAGYLPDKSPVVGKRHTYPEMAAAGLWTTAEDLDRFAIEVQRALVGKSQVLSQEMARKMVEPVNANVGQGLFVEKRMEHVYFEHGGWDEGFCAQLTAHRDNGYGVAVMINSNHPSFIHEVIRAVAEEYDWGGYYVYEPQATPAAALQNYPGRYRYDAEQMFTIDRSDDRLILRYAGWKSMDLFYVGDGRYVRRERAAPITFTEEDGKPVLHFVLDDGSLQSHAELPENEKALREILLTEPYDLALAAYQLALEQNPEEESLSEGTLNFWGVMMLEEGNSDGAMALFKINTELYPNSANTYDSVGYAYRELGDHDAANTWYRKSLDVDPDFPSAVKAIAELEAEKTAKEQAETQRASDNRVAMTLRALIDGSDLLKVRGNRVWFEHINHSLPGAWSETEQPGNEPTIVNGVEWMPQWDGRISDVHVAEGGLLPPDRDVHVSVRWIDVRGKVVKVEQPTADNDYTFTMMLDDDQHPGAAWYEIQLVW